MVDRDPGKAETLSAELAKADFAGSGPFCRLELVLAMEVVTRWRRIADALCLRWQGRRGAVTCPPVPIRE